MSKAHLAKLTGISPNSLVKYEKSGSPGGMEPSLHNIVKLAAVLDFDPRRVFERVCLDQRITDPEQSERMGEPVLFSFWSRWRERDLESLLDREYQNPRIRKIVNALAVLDRDIIGLEQEASYYADRARQIANQRKENETGPQETEAQNESGPDD